MAGFANEARFHMLVDQETLTAAVRDGPPRAVIAKTTAAPAKNAAREICNNRARTFCVSPLPSARSKRSLMIRPRGTPRSRGVFATLSIIGGARKQGSAALPRHP